MTFIARLDIERTDHSVYAATLSYAGERLDTDGGFTSIHAALESAANIGGEVRGLEVAYRGVTAGTYTLEQLRLCAKEIADDAVRTAAALVD